MSPAPRRPRLPKELFETRSHAWHSLGLGDELAPRFSKRQFGGLLLALAVIAGTLFVYYNRHEIAPGYGPWIRYGTVVVLVIVGTAATHWLVRGLSPPLYRRLDPATAGTTGFVVRLAAQQAMSGIFAGIVLQSTRPFRVGERVRLVGGALAGSLEGTVSSLGLFYTTLSQGADRLMVPNNVLLSLVVVPLREPDRVDVRVRFPVQASPKEIEDRLLQSITVPTRSKPSVSLEELDGDEVVFRITATPLRPDDGSQLAEEVLEALRRSEPSTAETRQP